MAGSSLPTGRPRILLLGGYGGGNLGDEALLLAAVQSLLRQFHTPMLTVATPAPSLTVSTLAGYDAACVPAVRSCIFRIDLDGSYYNGDACFRRRWELTRDFFSAPPAVWLDRLAAGPGVPDFFDRPGVFQLVAALQEADFVLITGGGFLTSPTRSRLWDNALVAALCARLSKPLVLRSQQLGPLTEQDDRERMAEILGAASRLSVRDINASTVLCRQLQPAVAVREHLDDATFAVYPGVELDGRYPRRRYITASFRLAPHLGVFEPARRMMVLARRRASERFALPLLYVPLTDSDVPVLASIHREAAVGGEVLSFSPGWERVRLLAGAALALSLPHHALIFALTGHAPVLPLTAGEYYTFKNRGSMGFLDAQQYIAAIDEDSEAARAALCDTVARLAQRRSDIEALLRDRVRGYASALPELDAWLYRDLVRNVTG
jgi:polysaccharide pyruvyl transferase WcaK-like protein